MIALINGNILPITSPAIEEGRIIIEEDKIVALGGSELAIPKEATIYDCSGQTIMPGLIDAHTHLGILEEIYAEAGDDLNEGSDPVTPHLRVIDAINPMDIAFQDAVKAGITTVFVAPGSTNVICGLGAAIHTAGVVVDEMILRAPAGLKIALGENPKNCYGSQGNMPKTRMGIAALLRENFQRAAHYLQEREKGSVSVDLKLEALGQALQKEIPLRVHAHRSDDIMTAIRIAKEFDVDLILEHCTEGHLIADRIAASGAGVVVGPLVATRCKAEMKELSRANPGVLSRAGLAIAIMTDHPEVPIELLPLSAALGVQAGLDRQIALEALTINPARLLGIEQIVGSLEVGKLADLVIIKGNILDINHQICLTMINGKIFYKK